MKLAQSRLRTIEELGGIGSAYEMVVGMIDEIEEALKPYTFTQVAAQLNLFDIDVSTTTLRMYVCRCRRETLILSKLPDGRNRVVGIGSILTIKLDQGKIDHLSGWTGIGNRKRMLGSISGEIEEALDRHSYREVARDLGRLGVEIPEGSLKKIVNEWRKGIFSPPPSHSAGTLR